jgi:hypothetical protein
LSGKKVLCIFLFSIYKVKYSAGESKLVQLNNQGRLMALAVSKGYEGPFRNYDENKKVIEELFKEYKVWEK